MPLIETKGAASAQGFGEFAQQTAPIYIENVFSTYLYTGNGSTQTITNGIDLSGKGGLIWTKNRGGTGSAAFGHTLIDTVRGFGALNRFRYIRSNTTAAQDLIGAYPNSNSFNSNGYTVTTDPGDTFLNGTDYPNFVSWTFREQPKFFDVVTYTGASPSSVTVNHNLGSVPGCILFKCTNDVAAWAVYHRSTGIGKILYLNGTQAASTDTTFVTAVTSTSFTVGDNAFTNNSPAKTYVAYLFAHDAGGFGLTGSDNVISCGSYTGNGVSTGVGQGFQVTLGYEPQFVIVKRTSGGTGSWWIADNMRGLFGNGPDGNALEANSSSAEQTYGVVTPNATGFTIDQSDSGVNASGSTYIYIAIRRGPMKVPTSGTSVFSPVRQAGGGTVTTNFVVDTSITKDIAVSAVGDNFVWDRLRGSADGSLAAINLITNSTAAESAGSVSAAVMNKSNTAVTDSFYGSGYNVIYWNFRRAPGFFDEVCFSGAYTATSYNHNLTVAPEMIIFKKRTGVSDWPVYHVGISTPLVNNPSLNLTGGYYANNWFSSSPTATTFSTQYLDSGTSNYVAYLFATCAGVSKVGSYTGTGALQTVNCGFTGGARFVLIKRTDSTGDWYVYDSARGISSGNDPYLLLNSTAAEVTGTNYVDTTSVGFQVTAAAPAGLNANGGTYIFLAIA